MGLVSKECVNLVKKFEGFYSKPYYDCVGVKTLGYGMTGKEIQGLNYITESQASQMLEKLLNDNYALPLKRNLDSKGIHLTQNQFDALVSMAYNVGVGGVLGSTLYRNICNGVRDRNTITANFLAWSYAGGKQYEGLLRRRRAEANMFFGGGNTISYSKPTAVVNASALNVRERKDVNSHILGILQQGQAVEVYKIEDDWVHIYYPPHGGFISKKYVKLYNVSNVKKEEKKVKNIVIYNGCPDQRSAEVLADYLQCPTISNERPFDYSCVENVYAVGGKKENYTSHLKTLISGSNRYETMQKVLDFINKK